MSLTTNTTLSRADGVGVGAKELVVLLSSIMALMAVGIDLMLPGFDDMRETFGLGEGSNRTGQVITFYFFGLAIAQVIYGPLADRFGRKRVLYVGLSIYVVGAAASALAPTFELLLASRVLWGVGAAGARVVATSIIRDCFAGDRMAKVMSQVMAVFMVVPVFAPALGSLILTVLPWQAMFWFCAVWAGVVAVWVTRLHETLDPAHVRSVSPREVVRSYGEVARTRVALWNTLATVFLQAVFTTYLASIELIIGDIFDRESQFALIFGVVAVGFGISAILNSRLVERFGIQAMVRSGYTVAIAAGVALVLLSTVADGRPSFWLFMPVLAVALASFMLLTPNLNTAAMEPLGHVAGAGSAFTSAMRVGFGSVIASFFTGLIDTSVTPFAVVLLAMALCSVASWQMVSRRAVSSPG
ncbi:MAG: multidrug effflux MFS transporter [Actinomycetota bacterium]